MQVEHRGGKLVLGCFWGESDDDLRIAGEKFEQGGAEGVSIDCIEVDKASSGQMQHCLQQSNLLTASPPINPVILLDCPLEISHL